MMVYYTSILLDDSHIEKKKKSVPKNKSYIRRTERGISESCTSAYKSQVELTDLQI
jgi:hypothetical protein